MAAIDRRVPSLDEFVGQSWTAWADRVGVAAADDMSIFGLYPGHDDFYLVVCSHCGQVVKPQAFEKHCERRHGPLSSQGSDKAQHLVFYLAKEQQFNMEASKRNRPEMEQNTTSYTCPVEVKIHNSNTV
uniref:Ataxin-7-like protein 2 n=1 Tax=Fundulus heteroclitus TaxID=8078 RepID=A0A3Q2R4Q3_FUNHE